MAMPYSSIYLMLFLICTSYQYHGPLASTIPSNYTAPDHLAASAHGRVTNTNVTMIDGLPAMDLFESEQPSVLPRSKAKDWTAALDLSSGTLPYEVTTRNSSRDDLVKESVPCRGNCTSHTNGLSPRSHIPSASVAPGAANESATSQLPPHRRPVQRGVQRRHRKRGGTTDVRKLLGVHHHPARLPSERAGNGFAAIVVGSALSVLLCALAGLLPWCMHRHSVIAAEIELEDDEPMLRPELLRQVAGPRRYSYSKLATATSNFAESKRIGRGGFGSVYCGYLDEQDRHVAVKKFSMELLEQGSKEFEAEVKIMSQLRHRNLVQLVGWCDSRKGLLLVYDLVPGGSLDKHLYDPERSLTWQERYKIALALGSAIQYLHTECNQCVVHGDIKPSNIMLDSSHGDTKLGDFGLARLIDHGADPQTTHVVAGTVGYMDPEFVSSQKRGTESDVYSFGVVLLEIACGKRPAAPGQLKEASTLLKRVRDMYDRNAILDAADGRLTGEFDERQMERVLVTGFWCAHRDQSRRPSIEQAMSVLRSEGAELPVLPAATHGGSGQIRLSEERAYGDMSTRSSAPTAYHTPEDSECFYTSPLI